MRTALGKAPDGCRIDSGMVYIDSDSEWSAVAALLVDGINWFVFRKTNHLGWSTYKIVAGQRVDNKANYWFTYNPKERRMAFARDIELMRVNRPKLYEMLMEFIER
jgi:hypothetical protein